MPQTLPPWSKEEIDRRLEQLRSDPEKRRKFRAELLEKRDQLFARMPKYDVTTQELVSSAFSYLVHDYGYVESEFRIAHTGALGVEYESEKTLISIWAGGRDFNYFFAIYLRDASKTGAGGNSDINPCFRNLLEKRCPSFEFPPYSGSLENLKSHIDTHAFALEKYASDVIKGDLDRLR